MRVADVNALQEGALLEWVVIVDIITYRKEPLINSEQYIGLDVHRATISVAVLDVTGRLVMESILQTNAATILQFLRDGVKLLPVTFEQGICAARSYAW